MTSHPVIADPPPVFGYYSEGYQRHVMKESCLRSHYHLARSMNKTLDPSLSFVKSTGPVIEQFTACYVPCDSRSNPISYLNTKVELRSPGERSESSQLQTPFCVNNSWSDCDRNCKQTRSLSHLHFVKNHSGTFYECRTEGSAVEERKCSKGKCRLNVHAECVHILQITLPAFDDRLWSAAWKDELIESLSRVLHVGLYLSAFSPIDCPSSWTCHRLDRVILTSPHHPTKLPSQKCNLISISVSL
jgi:hypothetical protein